MKKEHKIVLLPTDKPSKLYYAPWDEPGILGIFTNPEKTNPGDTVAHHLYITSSCKGIKIDEWYIDDTNTIRQAITDDEDYWSVREDYQKILATTDELTAKTINKALGVTQILPQIPQDFINKFVEEYNQGNTIDKVLVEYTEVYPPNDFNSVEDARLYSKTSELLKLNPDNAVNLFIK